MNTQRSNIFIKIFGLIIMVVIVILVYMLASKPKKTDVSAFGTGSPQISETNTKIKTSGVFSDGLSSPISSETQMPDETGAGTVQQDVYSVDINRDGVLDRIVRTRKENGTAHFSYEYKVNINKNGAWYNITPNGFYTTEGAECALQKLQFIFKPEFSVVKISRPWSDSWGTPTVATKSVFKIKNDKMVLESSQKLQSVCNVSDLFEKL